MITYKSLVEMTLEELDQIRPLHELEEEALGELNLKVNDCILIDDVIRHQKFLCIVEEISKDNIVNILAPYGHSLTSVFAIEKNYGNIGDLKQVSELHPEYFI